VNEKKTTLSDEERRLLMRAAQDEAASRRTRRPVRSREAEPVPGDQPVATPARVEPAPSGEPARALVRGTLTPAQFEDDGWAGVPVQMRG
jgi:hypothetical protein